ncbi:MAG: glycosyltransferase [Ignavibacteria bacterium]|nr:glycosyltransferase [Ignavibacteria bacterium]
MKIKLFLGPYPPPVNGHSMAFKTIVDNFHDDKLMINQNFSRVNLFNKLLGSLRCIIIYIYYSLSKDINTVYCAGSRSLLGGFKDVIAIHIFSRKNVRILLHIHASNFDKYLDDIPSILKQFYISAYKKVDLFILLLEEMKSEYEKYFTGYNMLTIPNSYDNSLDVLPINLSSKNNNIIRLLYLSNIIYSKGIIDLLKAFSFIEKEFDNVKLEIAGDFSGDKFYSKKEIEILFNHEIRGLKNIYFHGPVFGNDKIMLLNSSDIFVLPSFYTSEAMPISIIEAMRAGNAIISTHHHYLDKIVGEKNGKCVEVKNHKQVYDAIKYYIINSNELRSVQQFNINYSIINFNQDKYISSLTKVIKND